MAIIKVFFDNRLSEPSSNSSQSCLYFRKKACRPLFSLQLSKIVGQAGFYSFGRTTGLEGKAELKLFR